MKVFTVLILFFLCFFNISCTHQDGLVGAEPIAKSTNLFSAHPDLIYGADPVQQSLDLFLPAKSNRNTTGVIIFIHGGGWTTGVKDDFNNLGMDTFFTQRNYAVITMNYRLVNKYPYPNALDDIDLVLNYIQANADKWNINANKICLFGRSSGAHLALQYAYTRNISNRIKAVVDCFGPVDFTRHDVVNGQLGELVAQMLGPYIYNEALWHDASPINHLSGAVPTAIMQGSADSLVYASQSVALQDSLLARGIPSIYLTWAGNGHGWNQGRWIESREVVAAWLKQYL